MNAHAMELKQVSISFQGEPVLCDLSYAFARQKVTGIIGPSGSGKVEVQKKRVTANTVTL